MKKLLTIALAFAGICAAAQTPGSLTPEILDALADSYENSPSDKAIRNALNQVPLATLAVNAENAAMIDTHFSDCVQTKGITDQKSSGRCWLFTGLNVLRAAAINKYKLDELEFSQTYCFFWDQLEKCNLFLQAVIDTRKKPITDREVDWLFSNPLGDGGTFTGVANLVMKYGVVPSSVMPESYIANNTSAMSTQLKTLLRQDGLELREEPVGIKRADVPTFLQDLKLRMLKEIYHVLALSYGVPPKSFEWQGKTYTPVQFYNELLGYDLEHDYIMLMNDPSREYGKVYEIEYDRHTYDGQNWLYINLPIEDIKDMAIKSIKADKAMYFSCDVAKFLDRKRGVADLKNFDYESLLDVEFTMDKKQRVMSHASGSSHAMTLIGVDLKNGVPQKWMVENSWGNTGYNGKLIMTDEWFNEYMFRLVVEKQFVPEETLKLLEKKPIQLPAWDPMFLGEE